MPSPAPEMGFWQSYSTLPWPKMEVWSCHLLTFKMTPKLWPSGASADSPWLLADPATSPGPATSPKPQWPLHGQNRCPFPQSCSLSQELRRLGFLFHSHSLRVSCRGSYL